MSHGNQAWGHDIETTFTSAEVPVGTTRFLTADQVAGRAVNTSGDVFTGEQVWMFVYNDEASTAWAEGDVIIRDTTTVGGYDGILHAGASVVARHRILGVAQFPIAAGSWGWILRKGIGNVRAGTTGITADTAVVTEDANTTDIGKAKVWETQASGEEEKGVFALALETAADGALAACYIDI